MTYLGPATSTPLSEYAPFPKERPQLTQCFARGDGDIRDQPILITRPEGMSDDDWHNYHCRELSRLRQERNRRGDVTPLNRGKVEVERVAVLRV